MKGPLKCFKMAKKKSLALLVKKLYLYLNVLSKLKNDKLYLFYMEQLLKFITSEPTFVVNKTIFINVFFFLMFCWCAFVLCLIKKLIYFLKILEFLENSEFFENLDFFEHF